MKYRISGDKDGNSEFSFEGNDKVLLTKKAKEYIKKGYFVFLENLDTGKITELKNVR